MAKSTAIQHILFDLDNTLYSASNGLEKQVSKRLLNFVSQLLNISYEESEEKHRSVIRDMGYSTTLEWLITEKGFTDIDTYYAALYPENEADNLPPDPQLRDFLASIPLPKAVLSNSNQKHVECFLKKLGIMGEFQHVFDIKLNNFMGKPHKEAFFKALEIMNAKPGSTLFIDDYPEFVAGFNKIGGKGLLFDEFDKFSGLSLTRIKSLYEISKFL